MAIARSLAFPKTYMVRHDDSMRLRERRNETTIEISPRRLTMKADDRIAVPLIDVMHPKSIARKVVRCKWPRATEVFVLSNHCPLHLTSVYGYGQRCWAAYRSAISEEGVRSAIRG